MTDPQTGELSTGWYPTETGVLRYWDGTQWLDGEARAGMPPAKPAASAATPAPAPAAAPTSASPAATTTDRFVTASLVLGIITIVLALIPFVDFVAIAAALLGFILGILALRRATPQRVRAIVGVSLSAFAVLLAIASGIGYYVVFNAFNGDSSSFPSESAPEISSIPATPDPNQLPDPTGNYYDRTYGTFAASTLAGKSLGVITLPADADAGLITATYSGSSTFTMTIEDATGKATSDAALDVTGPYSGTTAYGFVSLGVKEHLLKIDATGPWKVTISPIGSAHLGPPASGKGNTVFIWEGAASTWHFATTGKDNFIVEQYHATGAPDIAPTGAPGININTIGATSKDAKVDAGPSVIVLQSDGPWTIEGP